MQGLSEIMKEKYHTILSKVEVTTCSSVTHGNQAAACTKSVAHT
jgi:hypothetical protein